VLLLTDNEATRPTFMRTRPALHEAENEAEAGYYEAEAEAKAKNFASRPGWPRGLNIPGTNK